MHISPSCSHLLPSRAVEHPSVPEDPEYVRVRTYESQMVIRPHKTFDEVSPGMGSGAEENFLLLQVDLLLLQLQVLSWAQCFTLEREISPFPKPRKTHP